MRLLTVRIVAGAALFLSTVAGLPGSAQADHSTLIFTTIPVQVKIGSDPSAIAIKADDTKKSTETMEFSVDVSAIPSTATLTSCAVRLVTKSGLAAANDNGVHLQLFDISSDNTDKGNAGKPRQVAARTVDPGTDAGTPLLLETKGLCDALQSALVSERHNIETFRLLTTTANASITFSTDQGVGSSEAPRLILTYDWPDSSPGLADWAQSRSDPQNSGRFGWRMYDADRSPVSSLAQFTFQLLGTDSFDNVSPPVLIYDRRILAVVGQQDLRTMNGDGTLVSNRRLPIRPKFVAVSRRGWFYDVGEKAIYIGHLDSTNSVRVNTNEETALEPPTIGNDGSMYVVTNQNIYAFPPPSSGGQPNQAIAALWRYRTGETSNNDVSAVALSDDGRTVFVVDKATSQLIALDAATGRRKWLQADIQISRSANEPMPIPVVAGDAVFITNQAPTGGVLYIVTDGSSGRSLEKLSGTAITAPVVGPDQSAYVIRDGSLQRLGRDPTDQKFTAQNVGGSGCNHLAGFDLLRVDQSGDIYGLDRTGARIVYIRSNSMSVPVGVCNPMNVANLGATLAIAPDGTAYNYNQKGKLLALSPLIGDRNTGMSLTNDILKLNPDKTAVTENNETTFRAAGEVRVDGLQLPANADVNIVAGKSVGFGPGLRIADGSRLHVRVGFCPAQSASSECQVPGNGTTSGTAAVAATK